MNNSEVKKILVTGGAGQLGSEIQTIGKDYKFDFTFIDVAELDLCNESAVKMFFSSNSFDYVINCAAYTAVDLAEDNHELSFKVNANAVKIIAEICKKKIRLFHISTDYVFSGESNQPIREDDIPSPLSVYGHSKLEGEKNVASMLSDAYIIRTAWVYSTFGKNFVKTISALAKQRPELNVVADQIGAPTYARDLARAILTIITKIESGEKHVSGIYHYSNEGVISWYDLAQFIVKHYRLSCKINPIRTEEYKTKAVRPKFSLLDKKKIKQTFGIVIPYWYDSLEECLQELPLNNN